MSHLISFSRNQTKHVIKFLFKQMIMPLILRFFLNQPLKQWLTGKKEGKQWLTGKKEGKTKIQKFEYLKNKKSFLDESIFHSF